MLQKFGINLPPIAYPVFALFIVSLIIKAPKIGRVFRALKQKSFMKNPKGSDISPEEIKKMSVGAIFCDQQGCFIDSLTTGKNRYDADVVLKNNWEIFDKDTAVTTLEKLKNEGNRSYYNFIMNLVTREDSSKWEQIVVDYYKEPAEIQKAFEFLGNLQNTREELIQKYKIGDLDYQNGIAAWDMGRLTVIARLCYDKGYIEREQALGYVYFAYDTCKEFYNSWEELAHGYLLGRAMWGGLEYSFEAVGLIAEKCLTNENSPWATLKF